MTLCRRRRIDPRSSGRAASAKAWGVALVLVVAGGCSGRRGPDVQMVEGVVLFDGQPIADANVGFSPQGGERALPGTGVTQADGSFRLTATRGGGPKRGIPEGDYAVVISKVSSIDPAAPQPQPSDGRPFPKVIRAANGEPPYLLHLPEAYGDRDTSGLEATVKKGKNSFAFELRSDFGPPLKR